jgi:FkbH-like protein
VQLRITATSFLLPGSPAWKGLAQAHGLDFGGFGDWPAVLSAPPEASAIAWVVLLDDLLGDGVAEADRVVHALFTLLDGWIARGPRLPLIVAWASPNGGSLLDYGREMPARRALAARFESGLYERAKSCPALHILPLDVALAGIGFERCYDSRNYYSARCRLSLAGLRKLADGLATFCERLAKPARKVLVLDCDNTLWGGVIGEDGLEGLTLGQDGLGSAFVDFQRVIRNLAAQGAVLALASKNEEADVWTVFDRHPGMVLRRQNIAAWRINWREKADNLRDLAEELGLGLGSFVFWDDNPIERAKLREALPEVLVPECPAEVIDWPAALAASDDFARFETTAEDRRKGQLYKARSAFVSERAQDVDEGHFLKSIALRPKRIAIDGATIARAAQLCAKTNQFNLRVARHSQAELQAVAGAPGTVAFLTSLADRFGDHGIVGLAVARAAGQADIAFLDTFLMSCRVIGRHLEAWMLDACVRDLRRRGIATLVAEFVAQERNRMAASFLADHGFSPLDALPPPRRAALVAAADGLTRGGALYAADLASLRIPHMDLYADAEILARSA